MVTLDLGQGSIELLALTYNVTIEVEKLQFLV